MTAKKAVGFPIFYRTPRTLAWQGFEPLGSAIYRTEHMARTAENPKNHGGFPFYSSGASNPKGSGAQCCSPPDTVFGIETFDERLNERDILRCSPPDTVFGIETSLFYPPFFYMPCCSPPDTVFGIETADPKKLSPEVIEL